MPYTKGLAFHNDLQINTLADSHLHLWQQLLFCILLHPVKKKSQENFANMAYQSNHAVFTAFHCTGNHHKY